MKITTITCDMCKEEINENHITIGSESEKELIFQNKLENKGLGVHYIARYRDLHFCSKDHFIYYFFGKDAI